MNRDENEGERVWAELKKLWIIVGPAAVTRVAMNAMFLITQAYAGHLGELELASISIALTVITGFCFGFLVILINLWLKLLLLGINIYSYKVRLKSILALW